MAHSAGLETPEHTVMGTAGAVASGLPKSVTGVQAHSREGQGDDDVRLRYRRCLVAER